jgi:hypothetical protein
MRYAEVCVAHVNCSNHEGISGIMSKAYWLVITLLIAGVAYAGPAPTPRSGFAAKATAQNNVLCKIITPFYWEIGDASGTLVSESQGVDSTGAPILATTKMGVASSSKWLYGIYIVQVRGGTANLTAQDINFLHMTSGYTSMGGDQHPAGTCPPSDSPDSINVCLTLVNPVNDQLYSYQDPAAIGFFDYDAGHFENHASQYSAIGNKPNTSLGAAISAQMGPGVSFIYSQPLMAGGVYTTPGQYALVLRHIVDGSLFMHDALGTSAVCTIASDTCQALNSPILEAWHYSIAHWVEDDPTIPGDGAFSAPGGQGFYPWVEASKTYYGVIARATTGPSAAGFQSVECGRLIRHAWDTGIQQKGRLPNG